MEKCISTQLIYSSNGDVSHEIFFFYNWIYARIAYNSVYSDIALCNF
jgi:hypothetical protein